MDGAALITNLLGRLVGPMRKVGPYAAVALVVPGGGLIALSLWTFRRPAGSVSLPRSASVHLAIIRTTFAAFIALIPLLASCAGPGLFNMSDQWCAKHTDATAARCFGNQELEQRPANRD